MSTIVRSSLEEMLDSLRQRDENEKPKDLPPALPARPKLTSRTRPPSQRQPLSKRLSKGDVELENGKKKEELKVLKRNVFGAMKVKGIEDSESPYAMPSVKKNSTGRLREVNGGKVEKWRSEAEWDDRLDYFVKKVIRALFSVVSHVDCLNRLEREWFN